MTVPEGVETFDAVLPHGITLSCRAAGLWGDAYRAQLPSLLDGLDAFVPDLDVQRVPGATHWLVHEQPARVVAAIERLVGSSS